MTGMEDKVAEVVAKPFRITLDAHKPNRICYYGLAYDSLEEYKVKVSVDVKGKTGWIVTAYRVAEVPPNEPISWEPPP